MIAAIGRIRSPAVLRGHDADSGSYSTRLALVHAQASSVSRGKQATVVQRQGSSRTTTYYTSRSVKDSQRAPREGHSKELGGDVSSPASAPSPTTRGGFVTPTSSAQSDVDSIAAMSQDGVDSVPCAVHASEAYTTMPCFDHNTQGADLQLHHLNEGTSPNTLEARNMAEAVPLMGLPVPKHAHAQAYSVDSAQDGRDPADPASLAAFLCARGFSGLQAERLALELHGENSTLTCIRVLEHQLQKLESILPGMDIRALIVKDSLVLGVDAMTAARRLVLLDSQLGHPDLTQLIKTAPQLLYAEEVEDRLKHCLGKLQSLLPADYPLQSLQKLLVEAPTIIFRMDYYVSATCLDDLPADLLHQLNGTLTPQRKNSTEQASPPQTPPPGRAQARTAGRHHRNKPYA